MYSSDLQESDVFTALRAFILDVIGSGVEVIRTPTNRVAMPKGTFIAMTPLLKEQIEWPHTAVSDPSSQPQHEDITGGTRYQIQLDVYGKDSGDLIQKLFVVLQGENAFDFFAAQDTQGVYPIYADTPHQLPLIDGEAQYEVRWTMAVSLQYNPTLSTPVQTASAAVVGIINVEATYT